MLTALGLPSALSRPGRNISKVDVQLRHYVSTEDQTEYFYDGELTSSKGVLSIPLDNETWIRRAYMDGYDLTADGKPISDIGKFIEYYEKQSAKSRETDESETASADGGRQPI